jgi:pimeloyl-ACP methyl ester carboxylesterase
MVIYFISGLGADERAFQKLSLPTNWTIKHLKWLDIGLNETLESYVLKFSKLIDISKEFVLVGLSFGGIMATELNKIIQPKAIILLSSITTRQELPVIYKLIGLLKINRLIPQLMLNKVFPFTDWYFGIKTKEEKILLRQIIHDTPPPFLKWAINEILHWKNTERPATVFHIHGTKDRIFPIRNLNIDLKIKNGGHFMVYTKADEISKILIERLSQ